mgnify:CR=1 FL=1
MISIKKIPHFLLYFLNNSLESLGVVDSEVGKHFAVDFDAGSVELTHEHGVREAFDAGSGVDTLNPKCAEVTLFILTVAISVSKTFFPSILGNGPNVFAGTIVTASEFQNSFTLCTRSDVVY